MIDPKDVLKVRIPRAGEKDPHYISDLRKGLNSLANKGRDLHFAGKDQVGPVNPIDQQFVDYAFKEARATRLAKEAADKLKESKTGDSKEHVSSIIGKLKEHPYIAGGTAAALAAGLGALALRKRMKKVSQEE